MELILGVTISGSTAAGLTIDGVNFKGNSITLNGTVDGVDVSALKNTVDGKANSATSLSGYGITNAYTKTEVDASLATKATQSDLASLTTIVSTHTTDIGNLKTATTGMSYSGGTTTLAGGLSVSGSSTIGGVTLSGNNITLSGTVDGVDVGDLKSTVDSVKTLGSTTADNTKGIVRTGDGTSGNHYVTTIEGSTAIAATGISTNTVTASGTITANAFVENGTTLAGKYAAKGTVDTLVGTVGDSNSGLVKSVADLNTHKADKATSLSGYGITNAYTKTEVDASLATKAAQSDLVSLTTTVGTHTTDIGSLKTATTGMGYSNGTTTLAGRLSVGGSGTIGGVTLNGNNIILSGTVDGVDVGDLKSTVDSVKILGSTTADNTKGIVRTGDGTAGSPYVTTIEGSTAISATGISTNTLTASGKIIANELVENGTNLAGKYAAKGTVDTLVGTVGDSSSGLVKSVADLNTHKADKATTLSGYGITDAYTKTAADSTFATATDVSSLRTTVGNKADKATTLSGYGITNAYTKTEVDSSLASKAAQSDVASLTTTVGTNTTDIGNLKTATTGMSYSNGTTTLIGGLSVADSSTIGGVTLSGNNITLSGTVDGVDISSLSSSVTDNANNITTLQTATTGMSYANGTTTFSGGLAAGSLSIGSYGMAADGSLNAKSVNGVTIDSNNTTIGSYSLKTMSDNIRDLQNSSGGGSSGGVNTAGIIRGNVDLNNDGTTTIEGSTAISTTGISTNAVTASGTITAGELVENGTSLSNKYAAKGAVDTLVSTVGDSSSGLVKSVADLGSNKADKATTLSGYGITDAYTQTEVDSKFGNKADKATLLAGYGITDAYTKTEVDVSLASKAAQSDLDSLTTTVGTHTTDIGDLKTATTGMSYSNGTTTLIGGLSVADSSTIGGVTLSGNNITLSGTVDGVDISTLNSSVTDNTNNIATLQTTTTGMSYANGTTTFSGGLVAGSLSIGSYGMAADGSLSAKSVNGVTIDSNNTTIGSYSLKTMSDNIRDLQNSSGGGTSGGVNTAGIIRGNVDINNDGTTTIEGSTAISTTGISTNAVTASGTITAGELVENGTSLSNKYAAKGAVDTLVSTVGDGSSGLVKSVNDLGTNKADKATSISGYGITDAYTKTEMDTSLASKAAQSDLDSLTTTVGTHTTDISDLKTATTGMSYSNGTTTFTGGLSVAGSSTIGGVTLSGNNITLSGTVDGVDISNLSSSVTDNTNNIANLQTATTGMSYANGTTTFSGALAAGSLSIGSYGMAADGSLSAKSVNGVTIDSTNTTIGSYSLKTMSDNIRDLQNSSGGGTSGGVNTAGISRGNVDVNNDGTTTIEGSTAISTTGISTNAVTASGTITAGEFVENGTSLSSKYAAKGAVDTLVSTVGDSSSGLVKSVTDLNTNKADKATTLSGYGIIDAYTQTEVNTKLDTKAAQSDLASLTTTVDTHTTDIGSLKTATTGMGYSNGTTTFAGGLSVGGSSTIGGVTLNGNNITLSGTVDGVDVGDLKNTVDSISSTGTATTENTKGIRRSGDGTSGSPYVTTIEGSTLVATTGISTNALVASGTITANEFVENGTSLSGKYAAKGAVDTLVSTVGDSGSGLVKSVADLNTNKADKATTLSGYGITDAYTQTEVNTKLDTKAAQSDLASLTTTVGTHTTDIGSLKTATTGMGYSNGTTTFAGGLSVGGSSTIGGVTLNGNNITLSGTVDGVDVGDLKNTVDSINTSGAVTAENTKGIVRSGDGTSLKPYATTIEGSTAITGTGISTSAVIASGTITANEFVENGTSLSGKYAAKGAVDTLVSTVGDSSSGLVKSVADLGANKADKGASLSAYGIMDAYTQTEVDTKLSSKLEQADLNNLTATVDTHTTDIGNLKSATTGMSYSNGTTTFAGGLVANSLSVGGYGIAADGSLTAKTVNGLTIDSNNTTIGSYSLKTMSDNIRDLQNSSGGGTGGVNTAGISRGNVDVNNDGTTTIETNTNIDKDGLSTKKLEATNAKIGGISFSTSQDITDVASINGIAFGTNSIGGVNFAGNGVMSNIVSINGIGFSSDGKIGGVSLSGGQVNGVDVGALQNRVTNLENNGGGGSGSNTGGIVRPDPGKEETVIEGNTTVGTDGIKTNNINASDKVTVSQGKDNQVTINEAGIQVGVANGTTINSTNGFISDKGLYIGVDSSGALASAKFSVAPNGDLSSGAGGYTFSNTAASGAVFASDNHNTAFVANGATDTTIKGNTVTTGSLSTDKLIVNGTEVTVAGGVIGNGAVDNHLKTSDNGRDYDNEFATSAMNGTSQSSSMTSGDTKVGFEVNTKYDGMTLTSSKTVTDASGTVTQTETGKTSMSGDSILVSKDTANADGSTTTNSTNVGSGEITLNRQNADGTSETIQVGSAITGLQSDVRSLDSRVTRMGVEIKEVGALSAALAGLNPMPEDANTRTSLAMAVGSYEGKQAIAVGGFYRANRRTMLSVGGSFTSSKQMFNMGVSFALDKMPETLKNAKMRPDDRDTLQMVLARLDEYQHKINKLEEDNKKLAAEYAELKAKQERKN